GCGRCELPDISKKIFYVDTSTVSHRARALARREGGGPWISLYHALRDAVASDIICCPGSSIVEEEGELAGAMSAQIVTLSRELASPGLQHELWIREVQVFNALKRFLSGEDPAPLARQDPRDAFYGRVHIWTGSLNIIINSRTPEPWIQDRREAKEMARDALQDVYQRYADEGLDFDAIRSREASALGPTIESEGKREIRQKLGLEPVPAGFDLTNLLFPS